MPSCSNVRCAGRCGCSTILKVSSFSEAGYLKRHFPHPRSYFFEQSVLEREVGNARLQRAGLAAQILDLVGGGSPGGATSKPALAGFENLLRPDVIDARGYAFLAEQFGDAVSAAPAIPHDPDLVLRREVPLGRPREREMAAFVYRGDGSRVPATRMGISYSGCRLRSKCQIEAGERLNLVLLKLGADVLLTVQWRRARDLGVKSESETCPQ